MRVKADAPEGKSLGCGGVERVEFLAQDDADREYLDALMAKVMSDYSTHEVVGANHPDGTEFSEVEAAELSREMDGKAE